MNRPPKIKFFWFERAVDIEGHVVGACWSLSPEIAWRAGGFAYDRWFLIEIHTGPMRRWFAALGWHLRSFIRISRS